jgi:hypothetical protein
VAKQRWQKTKLRLAKNHKWDWTGKPGYNVFVANRGAVRFEYPHDWLIKPDDDADIKFVDQEPPDDLCILRMTLLQLRPDIDWTGLPLAEMLEASTKDSEQIVLSRSAPVLLRRQNLEIAWRKHRFVDPVEHREACSHTCLARSGTILPLITFEYWPEDAGRFGPVWEHIMATLRLGEYVKDPRVGATPHRYG